MNKEKQAILLLEDGREFHGSSFGYEGETVGEVCFNTGMSGASNTELSNLYFNLLFA